MAPSGVWTASLSTVALLLGYEAVPWVVQRRHPHRLARSTHVRLRAEWFAVLSRQRGSELLAVQTLRNSVMSATMTASTAAIALMGSLTLAAPTLGQGLALQDRPLSPRLVLELLLIVQLFASLVCSAMAVRYHNHAGFIASMPVGSEERERWTATGLGYLRRGGLLYSWGLRHLVMVAPAVVAILHPAAGPVAAVTVIALLASFDRFVSR